QVGNGSTNGTLGGGAVTDNGTLAFNRSDNLTVATTISGSGGVSTLGPNVLSLSGANSFTGPISVASGGTLKVTASSSVGATAATLANRTLDLQGHTLTTHITGTANTIFGILDGTSVTAGNMVVDAGGLDPERACSILANGSSTITFNSGTTLQSFEGHAGSLTRPVIMKGSNLIGGGSGNPAIIDSPMTLQGDVTLEPLSSGVANAAGNNPIPSPASSPPT